MVFRMVEKKKKKVKWFWEKEPNEFEEVHDLLHTMGEPFGMKFSFPQMRQFKTLEAEVPVNVSETDIELIVRAELPGFKKDEIKLVITKDTFELTAEKKHEEIERSETFYRREVGHKSVHRAFALPVDIDADKVSAKLEEGVLTVTMPKLETEKKRKKAVEID